jgi:hypothetical protein
VDRTRRSARRPARSHGGLPGLRIGASRGNLTRMRTAVVVAITACLLAVTPAAQAAPPVLQSVSFDNATKVLSVNWSLPPGVETAVLEANRNPALDSDGYFLFGPNDGYYGPNIVFEVPGSVSTSWLHSYPDLPPGLYYVHVGGYDSTCTSCPIREWTSLGTFTVPAPPPPRKNKPPRLLSVRWREVGHLPAGRNYYVTETLRFNVCDDAPGPLTARVGETKKTGPFVGGRAVTLYRLSLKSAGCRSYKISWRLKDKFFGVGRYTVTLRIRDSDRAWSRIVTRSTYTPD